MQVFSARKQIHRGSASRRRTGVSRGSSTGEPAIAGKHRIPDLAVPEEIRWIRPKKNWDDIESKLTAFSMENNGRLPNQVNWNMAQLQLAADANVTALDNLISRASRESKKQLQTELGITRALTVSSKGPRGNSSYDAATAKARRPKRLAEADREIQSLETGLTTMCASTIRIRTRTFAETVVANGIRIAARKRHARKSLEDMNPQPRWQPAALALKKRIPAPVKVNPATQREMRDLENNIQRIQSSLEAKDLEIEGANKDLKRTDESVRAYQGRLSNAGAWRKHVGMETWFGTGKLCRRQYLALQLNSPKALLCTPDMAVRKQSEALELQMTFGPAATDSVRTQTSQSDFVIGAALWLFLQGIVIVGMRAEIKNITPPLKNLKDVRAYTQMNDSRQRSAAGSA